MGLGILDENNGSSSMRVIFVFGSFWAMGLCTLFAFQEDVDPLTILAVYTGLQGTLGGLKLGQKQQENERLKNGNGNGVNITDHNVIPKK